MGRREKVGRLLTRPSVYVQFVGVFLQFVHVQCYFVGEPMECEPKMENLGSPDREGGAERDGGAEGTEGMADFEGLKGGAEDTEDSKKRKRKPYRPGQLPIISKNNL